MAHGRIALLRLLPWLVGVGLVACRPSPEQLDEEEWRQAEALWKRGDPSAFEAWHNMDPAQPHGRAAQARLREANLRYRQAVDILRAEQPGLRETLAEALALAPMDPSLYLPFARACRERGSLWRAADFYRKYLARSPALPETATARAELAALGGDLDIPPDFDQRREATPEASDGSTRWRLQLLAVGGAGVLALALTALILRRRRARSLREIVAERPEAHPTVAYQIGCLRHEFLKHRIGAAGEALAALAAGRASSEQRRFLEERLCKGEPLLGAWRAHVAALDRALGLRLSLARIDPLFRSAEHALLVLRRAASATRSGDAGRVGEARDCLQRLDRTLGDLVVRLAVCPLDEDFVREVLASTRSEWSSGKVELDEVTVGPIPNGVAVDVYRTDLRIVLKNLFRNAIAALAQSPPPRRLAVDVLVNLEPTGEEVVRIRVRDSGRGRIEELGPADPLAVEHGLGIVRTALLRYDGSLEVVPCDDDYAKSVVVRLFRSQSAPGAVGEAA
jgi:signal transduction histidine kinase